MSRVVYIKRPFPPRHLMAREIPVFFRLFVLLQWVFPNRESHGARRETNGGTGPPSGDVYAGELSSKQLFTVATTCSKMCFFCLTSGDSSLSCPLHSSAWSNIFPSCMLINTIFPNSPRISCSNIVQYPRWS